MSIKTYHLSELAQATDCKEATLRRWQRRYHIPFLNEEEDPLIGSKAYQLLHFIAQKDREGYGYVFISIEVKDKLSAVQAEFENYQSPPESPTEATPEPKTVQKNAPKARNTPPPKKAQALPPQQKQTKKPKPETTPPKQKPSAPKTQTNAALQDLKVRVKELEEQKTALLAEQAHLQTELQTLETRHSELNNAYQTLENKERNLQKTLKKTKKQYQAAQAELEKKPEPKPSEDRKELLKTMQVLRQKYEDTVTELETLKQQYTQVEIERDALLQEPSQSIETYKAPTPTLNDTLYSYTQEQETQEHWSIEVIQRLFPPQAILLPEKGEEASPSGETSETTPQFRGFMNAALPALGVGVIMGAILGRIFGIGPNIGAMIGAYTGVVTGGVSAALAATYSAEEIIEKRSLIRTTALWLGFLMFFIPGILLALATSALGVAQGQKIANTPREKK